MYQLLAKVFQGAHGVVQWLEPILVPICLLAAWLIVILTLWSAWVAVRDGVRRAQQMHQIPCSTCRFFTQDYHLKCPVRPTMALSEQAINCPDYEADPSQTTPSVLM